MLNEVSPSLTLNPVSKRLDLNEAGLNTVEKIRALCYWLPHSPGLRGVSWPLTCADHCLSSHEFPEGNRMDGTALVHGEQGSGSSVLSNYLFPLFCPSALMIWLTLGRKNKANICTDLKSPVLIFVLVTKGSHVRGGKSGGKAWQCREALQRHHFKPCARALPCGSALLCIRVRPCDFHSAAWAHLSLSDNR